ncbi:hypothetical protein ABZ468_28305 [Streptomyces sp. NPDC005708]|uniref:hypothetical protein n=1 Tax=Streptomyces sp. NPDC005708 TaxID=3154564 RepID=UPI0033EF12D8
MQRPHRRQLGLGSLDDRDLRARGQDPGRLQLLRRLEPAHHRHVGHVLKPVAHRIHAKSGHTRWEHLLRQRGHHEPLTARLHCDR